MKRPTKYKARDYENRYVTARFGEKKVIKKNKKSMSKYERTLLKEELKREVKGVSVGEFY